MANKKISDLPVKTTVDGTEELEINDSGTSKKITASKLKTKQLFPVWAERNGDLTDGTNQWSFGAGNWTRINQGLVLPFKCKLVAMSLSLEGAVSCEVQLWKNSAPSNKKVKTVNNRQGYHLFDESEQLEFLAGDYVAFQTVTGHVDSGGGVVCAWFEREV